MVLVSCAATPVGLRSGTKPTHCQRAGASWRRRASEGNDLLNATIDEAIDRKPKGHDFVIDRRHNKPAVSRHMSVTGG